MRSFIVGIVGLVMFLSIAGVEAKGRRMPETELLFSSKVGVLPHEHILPEIERVVLRWGRQYWPFAEFGKCFVELRTPKGVVRSSSEYWSYTEVEWQGTTYRAHCWTEGLDSAVYWFKVQTKK